MNRRSKRVASLLRGELSKLFLHEASDPSLSDMVITDVEVSDDLKSARVYYEAHSIDKTSQKERLKGLERALPFFRRRIGENLNLRSVPQLRFEHDLHSASVSRVMNLIDQVQGPVKGESHTTC